MRYELQHRLGKGRFAKVYRCVEKSSATAYAVKCFDRAAVAKARDEYSNPFREASVHVTLDHQNILRYKEIYEDESTMYLILELAPSGSLYDRLILTRKLTEVEARIVFKQLFEGLRYLHERQIIHRDIKPENILLTSQYLTVKICDFGLAQIGATSGASPGLYGSLAYMAPEVIRHKKDRYYTPAVDVWSAGVVLYICLCGYAPFRDPRGCLVYPRSFWDVISSTALVLVNSMLSMDARRRITIEGCLEHEWTTEFRNKP
jgi:serine/threonine-protein kinase Chk2